MNMRLTGLVAAPFTAFNADGSINLSRIEQQLEHLVQHGVRGAFVCGTTGEGLSLTLEERCQVAQRWVDVAAGTDLTVIIHVGHTCLAEARALATHAQQIKAHAVGAMGPYFFRPADVDDLVDFSRDLAAAAPRLPFYYYHIPSMTGVAFRMVDFLIRAAERVPNLAGVKFTHEDLMDYRQCLAMADGRFDMLFGRDEILLAGLSLGAQGAVGSTYNYAAPIYHRLIHCFQSGDLAGAQAQQTLSVQMIAAMIRHGGLAAGKAIMNMIGIDCGPVRLPLRNLTPSQLTKLRDDLVRLGFFDAIQVARSGGHAFAARSSAPRGSDLVSREFSDPLDRQGL